MAQQLYANKTEQSKHEVRGNSPDQGINAVPSFSEIAQQMLSILDTDKSGSIDKSEFSQAAKALAKSSGKTDTSGIDAAFSKADANNDGQISSDEFMNALKLATEQMQKKQHHPHHSDATASNVLALAESTQPTLPMNEIEKNLRTKVMAAYNTSATLPGSTTNISV